MAMTSCPRLMVSPPSRSLDARQQRGDCAQFHVAACALDVLLTDPQIWGRLSTRITNTALDAQRRFYSPLTRVILVHRETHPPTPFNVIAAGVSRRHVRTTRRNADAGTLKSAATWTSDRQCWRHIDTPGGFRTSQTGIVPQQTATSCGCGIEMLFAVLTICGRVRAKNGMN